MAPGSHTDSVMDIAWNTEFRHLIASGSADKTVKLWDITKQTCLHTFTHHTNKVQSVVFNPVEHSVIATGSFDRSVVVMDAKSPSVGAKFAVTSDIEDVAWNPHNPVEFLASTDDGHVVSYDVRSGGTAGPTWRLSAHGSEAVSSISFSYLVKGMVATASVDKSIKIWDIGTGKPDCVATKSMGIDEVISASFYSSSPWLLAAGGGNGNVAIWEVNENSKIQEHFKGRLV